MDKDEMKNRISMALKDPILQQGFEIICKENEELKKDYEETEELLDKQIEETYKLFKENTDLKEDNKVLKETISKGSSCGDWNDNVHACQMYLRQDELQECIYQLSKAKELLKWALHSDPEHDEDFDQKWEEAEQFLKL